MQKLGINTSDIKFLENVQNINANGIFTGDINNINIRAKTSFERLSSMYSGRIFNKEDTGFGYLGKLEFKTPDFVSFIYTFVFTNKAPKSFENPCFFHSFHILHLSKICEFSLMLYYSKKIDTLSQKRCRFFQSI